MSLVTRKPVFGVCDQGRLEPACSPTEASGSNEIASIETRDITLSRHWTTKALIRLGVQSDLSGVFKSKFPVPNGPRQANLLLIAYASSEGSGEPAHPRSLARTFAARSYKQWIKRNLQTESQIRGPSEWLGMRGWNLSWRNARRHKFAWRGSNIKLLVQPQKLCRGLKFRMWKLEVLYYLGREQQRCWSECMDVA